MLLYEEKLERILKLLETRPYWTTRHIAEQLRISRSTAQKCLQELHDTGKAERIHGGIRRKDREIAGPIPIEDRMVAHLAEKKWICRKACAYLPRKGYIYIDAGTTTLPLAREIVDRSLGKDLVTVTNDVTIAKSLSAARLEHILLGGRIHPVSQSISGQSAVDMLKGFFFDACFISVDTVDNSGHVKSAVPDEAKLKREAMHRSENKYLLAASSKCADKSGTGIGELAGFDLWITDRKNKTIVNLCKKHKVRLAAACAK